MFIEAPIQSCIDCALPISRCICQSSPAIQLPDPCHVLFHPREMTRRNSTGRLLKACTDIQTSFWHRLKNQQLEKKFQGYYLLYPSDTVRQAPSQAPALPPAKGFLWLDGTWQETQKMLRQSPWLHKLPKFSINAHQSQYRLRRNQTQAGLSTLECVAYWLQEQKKAQSAQELLHFFDLFQTAYLHAQQAGQLK